MSGKLRIDLLIVGVLIILVLVAPFLIPLNYFRPLTTNLRMAPDGLRADDFNAVVPALGTLTGAGTVDAKNDLDFKMVATLMNSQGGTAAAAGGAGGTPGGLLEIPGGSGGSSASKGQCIPFLIQGTTSDPKFVPDTKGLAAEMLKSQLGNLTGRGSTSQQPQNANNPLSGLGSLFKKKKN